MELGRLLSDPTSFSALKAADFWLGVVGFNLTLATFGLGWKKLKKVQDEVSNVKARFARYDAVFEVAEIIRMYDELSVELDGVQVDWRFVASELAKVKRMGSKIELLVKEDDDELAKEIRKNWNKAEKLISAIDGSFLAKNGLPEQDVVKKFLRTASDAMVKAKHVLEESVR